jgi:hypothetical protein
MTVRTALALLLTNAAVLAANAATIAPATVPASGRQEVLLTVEAPSALHFSARSSSGTSCELTDRVRGPFAQAGAAGGSNCELDLLLDAGQYKVRLESPRRGKGNITLSASPFTEINATPLRLTNNVGFVTTLKPRQQASYWLNVEARDASPVIRIAGRHAGDVRLWRNGQWLEPIAIGHNQFAPIPGQPIHEWWLENTLEAGEYKLVVYGRDSTTITGSSTDDSLTIEYGFRDGPPERSVAFTLPPSGLFAVKVPTWQWSTAAVLSLDSAPKSPVDLQLYVGSAQAPPQASCHIEKNALIPECSVSGGGTTRRVIMVRGAPGTRGNLEWAEYRTDAGGYSQGGYYGPTTTTLTFSGRGGASPALVGVFDLPNDTDAAPLGCQLQRVDGRGEVQETVARSAVRIGEGEMLEREFNYDEQGAAVWFEVGATSLLQRVGLSSSRYRIATTGGRKSTCEVYKVGDKGKLTRLTQSKASGGDCNEVLALDPGFYQLQLAGGLSGVEKLTIKEEGAANAKPVASRGGCLIPNLQLSGERYRLILNRVGSAVRVRGLFVQPLPLTGEAPLHLQLDAKQTLEVPVKLPASYSVRSAAAAPFGCAVSAGKVATKIGECELSAGADTLTLSNPSDRPINLTLSRPGGMAKFAAPATYAPTLKELARIEPETPTWFEFAQNQSQAVLFDVENSGLYNVTTAGLLSTSCRLRTPVIDQVAQNDGGGRGRNCLIQTYLQKGRYMLTASTHGASRGRGALLLTRRPVKEFADITGEGEQYFRVEANDLVQQKLVVKTPGKYEIGTTAQGVPAMQCRFDDPEGWPVEPVPSRCNGARELRAGTYLWTQLPLTVESMRHTSLVRAREEVVLKGNKPHKLDFFTWYRAELGPDGKDELTFTLEGETTVDVVLTNGMQGRVYLLEKDKAAKAIEVIPPLADTAKTDDSPRAAEPSEATSEPPPERDHEGSGDGEDTGESPPVVESEGNSAGEEEGAPPPAPPVEVAQAKAAPLPPSGVKLTLPAGEYKIVAEHSRADVGIEYRVHLGSATLLPGMARSLPAPSTVPVLIPRDGTLRLRTEGEADVRCRLFDADGKLVFEGSDNGDDWNCALAEPVTKGRYTLVLESETQAHGETRLSLALPPVEDGGPVTDAMKVTLAAPVLALAVPLAEKDAVQEMSFKTQSRTPLSCALENAAGTVVHRQARVTECTLLVRPRQEKFRVRLWAAEAGTVPVIATFRSRSVVEGSKGDAPADKAVAVSLAHAGRYRTSPQIHCIGAAQSGLLRQCGPEVSLESGSTIFSATGTKPQPLPLDENVFAASDSTIVLPLSRLPFLQNVSAPKRSLFLLEAHVQHGERAAPACGFDGAGAVRDRQDAACFAASRVGAEAIGRLWAASDSEVEARVTRRAVVLPEQTEALTTGRKRLAFTTVGRFALPKSARARLELTLPRNAWAVLLDDSGQALDLCAPTGDLQRCLLTGQAGSVVIVSSEGHADVTTVLLEGLPQSLAFRGLYEDAPKQAGTIRLAVPASDHERVTAVEGALRCTLALADGTRIPTCRGNVPAMQAAELFIEHGAGPLRATAYAPGREKWARLGIEPPVIAGAPLNAAVAVPMQAGNIDRTLVVDKEAVVRVASESGVCGLLRGSELLSVDGNDSGCEIVRVLSPGTYRLLVRPFAARPQPGMLRWTAEPVVQLGEGVGPEDWLAPGELRLYRFDTANQGKAGLGIQAKSEGLDCAVYDDAHQLVGEGCQQYLSLDRGRYLLTVRNPPAAGAVPLAFKPVLLGLSGEKNDIPEAYLQEFFRRVGVRP